MLLSSSSPVRPRTMAAVSEAPGRREAASCFSEAGKREIGSSSPRASSRRISGSEVILFRFNFRVILEVHFVELPNFCRFVERIEHGFRCVSVGIGIVYVRAANSVGGMA
jgi:hypothetical protein